MVSDVVFLLAVGALPLLLVSGSAPSLCFGAWIAVATADLGTAPTGHARA